MILSRRSLLGLLLGLPFLASVPQPEPVPAFFTIAQRTVTVPGGEYKVLLNVPRLDGEEIRRNVREAWPGVS